MEVWEKLFFLFKGLFFRLHVNFWGSKIQEELLLLLLVQFNRRAPVEDWRFWISDIADISPRPQALLKMISFSQGRIYFFLFHVIISWRVSQFASKHGWQFSIHPALSKGLGIHGFMSGFCPIRWVVKDVKTWSKRAKVTLLSGKNCWWKSCSKSTWKPQCSQ